MRRITSLAFKGFCIPAAHAQEGRQSYMLLKPSLSFSIKSELWGFPDWCVFTLIDISKTFSDMVAYIGEWHVGHLLRRVSRAHNMALTNTLFQYYPLCVPYNAAKQTCLSQKHIPCIHIFELLFTLFFCL